MQELIALKRVYFYNADWVELGTKHDLCELITEITRIEGRYLLGQAPLETASVAKRMSWAAGRDTTRPEDISYCLMGIFEVQMPLLYGEGGSRAFARLQETIVAYMPDHSMFAWQNPHIPPDQKVSMLAETPKFTSSIVTYTESLSRTPYQMTNSGINIELSLTKDGPHFVAALDCPHPDQDQSGYIGIKLYNVPFTENYYSRTSSNSLEYVAEEGVLDANAGTV